MARSGSRRVTATKLRLVEGFDSALWSNEAMRSIEIHKYVAIATLSPSPNVSIVPWQRSITIHDGFHRGLEYAWLCTESRGGPTWQFYILSSRFIHPRLRLSLPARSPLALHARAARAIRTNERPTDRSTHLPPTG